MSTDYIVVVGRKRPKAAVRRCTQPKCAELTRHHTHRCPKHR
ncbi:hypothetical protein [Rhodococcus sp. NPDC060176]